MTRALKLKVPEAAFQSSVIEFAQMHGWKMAHFRPAMTSKGWRTPVTADGRGFPDLVLVRDRVVFAELKGTDGRLRPEQRDWLDALSAAGCEAYLWSPNDWDAIHDALARREAS